MSSNIPHAGDSDKVGAHPVEEASEWRTPPPIVNDLPNVTRRHETGDDDTARDDVHLQASTTTDEMNLDEEEIGLSWF
jgi:hypothetical protein